MRNRFLAVAAFTLLAAACGGSAEVAEPPTTTVAASRVVPPVGGTLSGEPAALHRAALQSAVDKTVDEPPARVDGIIEVVGTDPDLGSIDMALPFSTSFDAVTGDGHMLMDFSGMADLLGAADAPAEMAELFDRFEVRQIGETAYVNFGFINMMFGAETTWVSMPAEEGSGFTQDFSSGINPYDATAYIESLSAFGGDVTVVGTETLRDVETTHYRLVADLETLAAIDPDAFGELYDAAPVGASDLPLDIWIDDLSRVHRFLFELEGSAAGDFSGDQSFEYMKVQFDFSNYGGRVTVEPPPADDVTDMSELDSLFGGDFGGFEA